MLWGFVVMEATQGREVFCAAIIAHKQSSFVSKKVHHFSPNKIPMLIGEPLKSSAQCCHNKSPIKALNSIEI